MIDNIVKNMSLFVDGRGYAGNIEEFSLPKLTSKMEEFRNGGMDVPVEVEMGMEKLECDFTLTDFSANALKLWGVASGNIIPMTMRGATQSEFSPDEKAILVNVRGKIKSVDPGPWKPGDKATLKLMAALHYYRLEIDGEEIHEIDVVNMVRKIDGVDQLAGQRRALGI